MFKLLISIFIIFGFSFTIWSAVGLARLVVVLIKKKLFPVDIPEPYRNFSSRTEEKVVAVVMAAYNEELVIADSINALKKIISSSHIYIGNDGSKDSTSEIARSLGCNVIDLVNGGKASTLKRAMDYFDLYNTYDFITFVDADTRLREDYFANALPIFADPDIVAIAGYARSEWKNNIFIAYRTRIWFLIQTFFRFGMTAKFANVNMIVPGFASIYRAKTLEKIHLDRSGLVIEDYNATFELQKQHLGKIGHSPRVTGFTQDPHTFKSYCGQIKRWNLGFWQTLRVNGFWPSFFWFNLSIYLFEMFFSALVFLLFPAIVTFAFFTFALGFFFSPLSYLLPISITAWQWLLTLLALDFFFTIVTAIAQNRPQLLFYGPTMLFFRWVDAYYFFDSFFLSFNTKSHGVWKPPERWQAKN